MTIPYSLPLDNAGWEAFAQARARGLSSQDAAAAAGYARPDEEASRLRKRPQIVERIGAIVEHRSRGGSGDLGGLIDKLIDLADGASNEKTADARTLNVARAALEGAGRLKELMPPEPVPRPPPKRPMTQEEWRQEFDPTLPGSKAWVREQNRSLNALA